MIVNLNICISHYNYIQKRKNYKALLKISLRSLQSSFFFHFDLKFAAHHKIYRFSSVIITRIKLIKMNPQLHYLEHVQNISIGKHCFKFARAKRFLPQSKVPTDYNYHPNIQKQSRSCNFGFGKRADLSKTSYSPSPNKYNVSKFPNNHKATTLGFSRDVVKFGTIATEVSLKAKIPPPGAYQTYSSIKSSPFTMKQKLPTELTRIAKSKNPGPGQYSSIGINQNGRYPTSTIKNVRSILMNCNKKQPEPKELEVGPGTYDLFNSTGMYSKQKIINLRKTKIKGFGSDKRPGPEYRHLLTYPGPGVYEAFSTFGENFYQPTSKHSKTLTQW